MNLQQYLDHALKITEKVGKHIYDSWNPELMLSDTKNEPLNMTTPVDLSAHQLYADFFARETPEISVHSEEGSRMESDFMWVIDPIEGTSNFQAHSPYYATQVCLVQSGIPQVAVIHMPALQETIYATRNNGAFLNSKRLRINNNHSLSSSLASLTRGGPNSGYVELVTSLYEVVRTIRIYGATGVDLAHVAMNHIQLCLTKGSKMYDIIPGALIVQEAGGIVKDLNGHDYTHESTDIIAGSEKLVTEYFARLD